MDGCPHDVLVLIPQAQKKLRCVHCHLTISAEELGQGICPECAAERGVQHRDFEEVEAEDSGTTRWRCERCGMLVERDASSSSETTPTT